MKSTREGDCFRTLSAGVGHRSRTITRTIHSNDGLIQVKAEVAHDALIFPLTESDNPLLREPCPHTRWSGLQIHCRREGPHEVRSAERIQRESLSLHARSSRGREVAAEYTGAKRASSLASAPLRPCSKRHSSDRWTRRK